MQKRRPCSFMSMIPRWSVCMLKCEKHHLKTFPSFTPLGVSQTFPIIIIACTGLLLEIFSRSKGVSRIVYLGNTLCEYYYWKSLKNTISILSNTVSFVGVLCWCLNYWSALLAYCLYLCGHNLVLAPWWVHGCPGCGLAKLLDFCVPQFPHL